MKLLTLPVENEQTKETYEGKYITRENLPLYRSLQRAGGDQRDGGPLDQIVEALERGEVIKMTVSDTVQEASLLDADVVDLSVNVN